MIHIILKLLFTGLVPVGLQHHSMQEFSELMLKSALFVAKFAYNKHPLANLLFSTFCPRKFTNVCLVQFVKSCRSLYLSSSNRASNSSIFFCCCCTTLVSTATISIELKPFLSLVATRSGTSSAMKPMWRSFCSSDL